MVPISGFFDANGLGHAYMQDVMSILKVGRWWYHSAMSHRVIWIVLVPATKNGCVLGILVEPAASVPIRLCYNNGVPYDTVDQLLPRAFAVNAPDTCQLRAFGTRLAGLTLNYLKVLYLCPSDDLLPTTPLPSHVDTPLVALCLRIYESSIQWPLWPP